MTCEGPDSRSGIGAIHARVDALIQQRATQHTLLKLLIADWRRPECRLASCKRRCEGEPSRGTERGGKHDALLDSVAAQHREGRPLRPDEPLAAREDLAVEHRRVPLAEPFGRAHLAVVDDMPTQLV